MASVITPDRFRGQPTTIGKTGRGTRVIGRTRAGRRPADATTVLALVAGAVIALGLFLTTRVFYSGEFLLPAIAGAGALVLMAASVLSGSTGLALTQTALAAGAFAAALVGRGGSPDPVAFAFLLHAVVAVMHALPARGKGELRRLFGAWSAFGTLLAVLLIVSGP